MLILAAANRLFLTPALAMAVESGDPPAAIRSLRRSLIVESGCALAILTLVAWLGLLAPPASGVSTFAHHGSARDLDRSAAPSLGTEGVSTCRSRWVEYHNKKTCR